MENINYPTKQAIESLIDKLSLPKPDEFTQDWEYEVTDVNRIAEFIRFYEMESISDIEKFTLMIIIIGSCNDAIEQEAFDTNLWKQVELLLIKDVDIHRNTISYWSCDDEPLEDCYYITSLIRKMMKKQL